MNTVHKVTRQVVMTRPFMLQIYCGVFSALRKIALHNKLAPYRTGGRLLLTANFKFT